MMHEVLIRWIVIAALALLIAFAVITDVRSDTPPGTLITFRAHCGSSVSTAYAVVISPIAAQIGRVYLCGSWRGNPVPGINVVELVPTPQGDMIQVDAITLLDGRLLINNQVVDAGQLRPP
ncbi:MAG: hypothetical protein ABFD54_11495 [Armatimonadota bacterium]